MKRLLLLLSVFSVLHANAQPYSICFAGTGLSSVKVENLTSGLTVNLTAGDVLQLTGTTGIPEVNNMKYSVLKIYPNPMTDKSKLEIFPPVAGGAIISVFDMTGKVITQCKSYLENHSQEFTLSGMKEGLYIVNVQGKGYQFSEKLLSNGKSGGMANIARESTNIQAVTEKKSINDPKGGQATVNMAYNAGERLKYTSVSGSNSTVITDIPAADKTVTFTFTECKDGDNMYYPVVQIGTQLWMATNLKTTMLKNGTSSIPNVSGNTEWSALTTPAYCWYGNNIANKDKYGGLYNWYTVNTGNLCPFGWHVPTGAEWGTLFASVGGTSNGAAALKEPGTAHWSTTNAWTTNQSGFTALPGGARSSSANVFWGIGDSGYWWSSSVSGETAGYHSLMSISDGIYGATQSWPMGFSVRCLKD
jgi:uncharacterized protein (TIGR02145 family)